MKKVARLVEFSLMTRVIVDENATDDEIIRASYKGIQDKITNEELGDNLVESDLDTECPFGTFDTDDPSIDRVILNVEEKQYVVIGKGIPVRVIKFNSFSDWDSVQDINGVPVFDIQIDDEPYQFQYVNLIWRKDKDNWEIGSNYQGVKVEVVDTPLTEIIINLFNKIRISQICFLSL